MRGPLVTIAIPTYNRSAGYLREALGSALAQDYGALEIVVVDNASTDATPEYVRSIVDERLRYVRNEQNLGVNGNFNACLQHARGDYFLLLHDDDRIDPDFVTCCMDALAGHRGAEPPGLIRTGTRRMRADGTNRGERLNTSRAGSVAEFVLDWFDKRTSLFFCSTLFRTEALRAAGGFHSRRELYIDVAAMLRIVAKHPALSVTAVKASFRRHGGNNGNAQTIEAWCDDSLYLLELMCELAPERADEIRERALRYFTGNNYNRVTRLDGFLNRLQAYWLVYRYFGYRISPLQFVVRRNYRRLTDAVRGSAAFAWLKPLARRSNASPS
jgi:glycosyltransferase involved in cell wall biosynthesis